MKGERESPATARAILIEAGIERFLIDQNGEIIAYSSGTKGITSHQMPECILGTRNGRRFSGLGKLNRGYLPIIGDIGNKYRDGSPIGEVKYIFNIQDIPIEFAWNGHVRELFR